MPQSNRTFKALEYFFIRSPLLPLSIFEKLSQINELESLLEIYHSYPIVQEALYISSPSLYEQLLTFERLNKKSRDQALRSLLRYFIRLSTRATPFGLLASVGIGTFSHTTKITLPDHLQIVKKLRIGMEWVFQFNKTHSPVRYKQIKVKQHNALSEPGERIFHHGFFNTDKKQYELLSIKKSSFVDLVLKKSENWIEYETLENLLIESFNTSEKKTIQKNLEELFLNQFLISELDPNLLSQNFSHHFLRNLQRKGLISIESIDHIHELTTKYAFSQPKENIELLKSLKKTLDESLKSSKFLPSETFLRVDSFFPDQQQTLHYKVREEVERVADFFDLWSKSHSKSTVLENYTKAFLEQYGTSELVPLLELIDEYQGLGIPDFSSSNQEKTTSAIEQLIIRKCQKAIFLKKKEISLSNIDILSVISDDIQTQDSTLSGALICQILANDKDQIEKGNFNISLFSCYARIGGATSSLGRFLYALPSQVHQKVQQTHKEEAGKEPNSILVELSWLPYESKQANVASHENPRKYTLKIPMNGQDEEMNLPLEDLFVYADNTSLFLFSKKYQKRILLTCNNLLDSSLAPPIVRLLNEISESVYPAFIPFGLSNYDWPYTPRIKYSKTVISPAIWRLRLNEMTENTLHTDSPLEEKLTKWLDTWEVPRYVCLTRHNTDHTLTFDRTSPIHLREILNELQKNTSILLYEKINFEKSKWSEGRFGSYQTELVFPFIRKKTSHFALPSNLQYRQKKCDLLQKSSQWIFLKLYLPEGNQNYFLINHLFPYLAHQDIKNWFFIRYQDPKDHIRLRVKVPSNDYYTKLNNQLHEWTLGLIDQSHIQDASKHIYWPEVNRYGGMKLIEQAEDVFVDDSLTAISLLHLYNKSQTSLVCIATLSIIDLIFSFGVSSDEGVSFLQISSESSSDISGFREHKSWLITMTQELLDPSQTHPLFEAFQLRRPAIQNYIKTMKAEHPLQTNEKLVYLNSFIHMHCNRLGLSNNKENQVRFHAYKTLDTLRHISSYKSPLISNF